MKTNLDALFKTDTKAEKEGVWFDLSEETAFLVKRFGGENSPSVKLALAKEHRPYAQQIANGTLPHSKEREIYTKIFIEASLVDWKGVELDGVNTPFSKEAALKLLMRLPELFDALHKYSSSLDSYKEIVGNS